ncbi:cellulose biosynthesis cyclic di-GMP-binding regulatory protein BcsB [Aureimonas frigidaquae]|uniref:Cyclic di-GMP-binding protein n=1 Tax=Aureimonas frigidaquae TaxID=424757 RepID=A0A0N7KXQ8_9HYPH|nr:cellulose biosynthesis cyclic di-GMP-binding regulatory protein BcsB [Aureimonas frigidaquae]BAT27601.1 cellulose synthase protein [Aureimonas frigidaquae]
MRMTLSRLAARALLSMLVLTGAPALAQQSSPFDMSGERPAEPAPVEQAPAPAAPPAPAQPAPAAPQNAPVAAPPASQPAQTSPAPAQAAATSGRRFIVPFERLNLPGEIARRAWSLYLTPEEAGAAATFNLGYQNAIFVAPESSRLRVSINGSMLVDEPIASSDGVSDMQIDVPPGVLKTGYNLVVFEASMRHRTDCSISSTYDLWTEITPARTFLDYADPDTVRMRRLDDLRGLGADSAGRTRFSIVVPPSEVASAVEPLTKLAQGMSLLASMPNQSVRVLDALPSDAAEGEIVVLLGPAAPLRRLVPSLPEQVGSAATLDFVDGVMPNRSVLVLSGPGWADVNAAMRQITAPSERPISVQRTVLSYAGWVYPDPPFVMGAASIPLSELGVTTTEFSGRRFNTSFNIGVPSDFYAADYGEAQLILDAAYSQDILPGSHLDIYVNGNIATTVPLGAGAGAILRQLPVNVTMRHFRPGINEIAIETVLLTESDAVCAPGASAGDAVRFALFDTSSFDIPNFARIGTQPNLPAVSGTGFPYNRATEPVPLILDRGSSATLSAAATFLARLSLSAGRIIDLDSTAPLTSLPGRGAIFVNTLPQVPVGVLATVGISEQARTSGTVAPGAMPTSAGTAAAMDRWSSQVGTNWLRPLERVSEWLSDTFDLSFDTLRLLPGSSGPYTPPPGTSAMIAQGISPDGGGSWLLVTAPTDEELQSGMETMTEYDNWPLLQGRLTSFSPATDSFTNVPVASVEFVQTQALSYTNFRLIAANALSENILLYAAMLFIFSAILGIATTLLARRLGRH